MYNEVWASCPKCGEKCYIQISEVVLGFGNFDLNDLSTFDNSTDDEVRQVKELVIEEDFVCNGKPKVYAGTKREGCYHRFNPLKPIVNKAERAREILFGDNDED